MLVLIVIVVLTASPADQSARALPLAADQFDRLATVLGTGRMTLRVSKLTDKQSVHLTDQTIYWNDRDKRVDTVHFINGQVSQASGRDQFLNSIVWKNNKRYFHYVNLGEHQISDGPFAPSPTLSSDDYYHMVFLRNLSDSHFENQIISFVGPDDFVHRLIMKDYWLQSALRSPVWRQLESLSTPTGTVNLFDRSIDDHFVDRLYFDEGPKPKLLKRQWLFAHDLHYDFIFSDFRKLGSETQIPFNMQWTKPTSKFNAQVIELDPTAPSDEVFAVNFEPGAKVQDASDLPTKFLDAGENFIDLFIKRFLLSSSFLKQPSRGVPVVLASVCFVVISLCFRLSFQRNFNESCSE